MPDVPKRPDFNLLDVKATAREYKARAGFLLDPERELKELAAEQKQKTTKPKRRRVY